MIDEGGKDKMQKDLGYLKITASQYTPQKSGNAMERFSKRKDEVNVHQGDIVESYKSLNQEVMSSPNQVYNRPFYQQEIFNWPNHQLDVQVMQQNQFNPFENHFYPMNRDYAFPIENGIHYMPINMFSQVYPPEMQHQEFQYFVVIDFEATCDKEKKLFPQEIIEFPSVLVNSMTGQLEASFQTYVRPAYHQLLSDFCKELTGIQQIQVDRGVPLSEALLMHDKWLEDKGIKHKSFAVVTWSNWDCNVMLESECKFKSIKKPPYFNRWINLRVPFQEVFGDIRCNLKEAVQLAGLVWEGRPHCGLDDARNTARLLACLMHRGFRFSITNTLRGQSAGRPMESGQQPQKTKGLQVAATQTQFQHPPVDPASKEQGTTCCYCGVISSKCVVRKPGPNQGRWFFGCGNWTAARRAVCNYFAWASP